jgi:hypothetical protein
MFRYPYLIYVVKRTGIVKFSLKAFTDVQSKRLQLEEMPHSTVCFMCCFQKSGPCGNVSDSNSGGIQLESHLLLFLTKVTRDLLQPFQAYQRGIGPQPLSSTSRVTDDAYCQSTLCSLRY